MKYFRTLDRGIRTKLERREYSIGELQEVAEAQAVEQAGYRHSYRVTVRVIGIVYILFALLMIVSGVRSFEGPDTKTIVTSLMTAGILLFAVMLFLWFSYVKLPELQYRAALRKGYPQFADDITAYAKKKCVYQPPVVWQSEEASGAEPEAEASEKAPEISNKDAEAFERELLTESKEKRDGTFSYVLFGAGDIRRVRILLKIAAVVFAVTLLTTIILYFRVTNFDTSDAQMIDVTVVSVEEWPDPSNATRTRNKVTVEYDGELYSFEDVSNPDTYKTLLEVVYE